MDRLDEIIRGDHKWCVREVWSSLVEESDYDDNGYAAFPLNPDIERVADLLRLGAPALCIRFREVNPMAWVALIAAIVELG